MNTTNLGDELHRVIKLALDSGEAATLAEAEQLFSGYRLQVAVGSDVACSPTLQAAILTVVNTARRCFLGGVEVSGELDVPLRVTWRRCQTLGEAIIDLRGHVGTSLSSDIPRIVIGDVPIAPEPSTFAVRATFNGWCGGAIPLADGRRLPEQQECTPAGVLAGALAVSEAFQFIRGSNVQAGRRDVGMSLWRPESEVAWLETPEIGPAVDLLPSRLWLIGLGHLGQAYLWTLGLLPYARPDEVYLVLQDYDTLVQANDSTSPLTTPEIIGIKKTRAMAHWCEERGFRTSIQERRFAANFRVNDDEPLVALCGVDNRLARMALEDVGFRRVIEAGLGKGVHEYLTFQVHTFPARRTAYKQWATHETDETAALVEQRAYQALADAGLDRCGLAMLAGRSVGASFVGVTVATLVIAELLRMILGEQAYEVIDGSLRSLNHRQAIINTSLHPDFNPGYTQRCP